MAVAYPSPGNPLKVGAYDFQRVDRGLHWAIKFACYEVMGSMVVFIVKVAPNGVDVQEVLYQLDDGFDLNVGPNSQNKRYMTVIEWFEKHFLPKLNEWLAKTFPPVAASEPVKDPLAKAPTLLDDAELLVKAKLVVEQLPDGTLVAKVKP